MEFPGSEAALPKQVTRGGLLKVMRPPHPHPRFQHASCFLVGRLTLLATRYTSALAETLSQNKLPLCRIVSIEYFGQLIQLAYKGFSEQVGFFFLIPKFQKLRQGSELVWTTAFP